jgi:hypothetical protein
MLYNIYHFDFDTGRVSLYRGPDDLIVQRVELANKLMQLHDANFPALLLSEDPLDTTPGGDDIVLRTEKLAMNWSIA